MIIKHKVNDNNKTQIKNIINKTQTKWSTNKKYNNKTKKILINETNNENTN